MKYRVTVAGREFEVVVGDGEAIVDGRGHSTVLDQLPGSPEARLVVDGKLHRLAVGGRDDNVWTLIDDGAVREVEALDQRTHHIRSLAGAGKAGPSGGQVKAPMPGMVVRVRVEVGQRVEAGQGLVVLEAMKMENELKAPAAGVIAAIHATVAQPVDKGALLVEIAPDQQ